MTRLASIMCAAVCCALNSDAVADAQDDADKLLADSRWQEAAIAYDQLLRDDQTSANNWMNLGSALEQLQRYKDAQGAYNTAISAGYAPVPRVRLALARTLA